MKKNTLNTLQSQLGQMIPLKSNTFVFFLELSSYFGCLDQFNGEEKNLYKL